MRVALRTELGKLQEVLKLFWAHTGSFVKLKLAYVLVLVLLGAMLAPLGAVILKLLVDRFTGQAHTSGLSIAALMGLYVLSQWLTRSIGEVRGLVYARAERRMFSTLSSHMVAHVLDLPLFFHLDRRTGALNQTLENGLQGFQIILHQLVFTVLPVATQLATIAVVLVKFNQPGFLAIFCLATLCYSIAFAIAAWRTTSVARDASTAHIHATAVMTDSLLNYEAVKLFVAESAVQERVRNAYARTEQEWVRFYRRYAVNGVAVATVFATFLGLSIFYSASLVQSGQMTVGDFVLVNSYMLQIMVPVEMLGYAVQGLSQGLAMIDNYLRVYRLKPESQSAITRSPNERSGGLEFRHVGVAYDSGTPILKDVSFALAAGHTLGIVGGSGAGKSTIVRLLVRLLEPSQGCIFVDGVAASELSLPALRQLIAVVPQDTVLFNDTIRYNIEFGKLGSSEDDIVQAAKIAGLHDFVMSLPDRYETPVGERGVKLSGGEKQRVAIARAALKKPRIFIFDEATSSLDTKTEKAIVDNLRELARYSTTIVIAHRLSTVIHAHEIVVLENGSVVERGTHPSLLQLDGRYASLWKAQQQGSAQANVV